MLAICFCRDQHTAIIAEWLIHFSVSTSWLKLVRQSRTCSLHICLQSSCLFTSNPPTHTPTLFSWSTRHPSYYSSRGAHFRRAGLGFSWPIILFASWWLIWPTPGASIIIHWCCHWRKYSRSSLYSHTNYSSQQCMIVRRTNIFRLCSNKPHLQVALIETNQKWQLHPSKGDHSSSKLSKQTFALYVGSSHAQQSDSSFNLTFCFHVDLHLVIFSLELLIWIDYIFLPTCVGARVGWKSSLRSSHENCVGENVWE